MEGIEKRSEIKGMRDVTKADKAFYKGYESTGSFHSADPLVAFIYWLICDHLPTGKLEDALSNASSISPSNEALYEVGWLGLYAQDIARQLRQHDEVLSK